MTRLIAMGMTVGLCFSGQFAHAQSNSLFGDRGPISGSSGSGGSAANSPGGFSGGSAADASTIGQGVTDLSGGFVGRGDNPDRFVGNQNTGQQGSRNNQANFSALGAGRQNFNESSRQGQSQRTVVRPRARIAFSFTPRSKVRLNDSVSRTFKRASVRLPGMKSVTVTVGDKGQLTLTGRVPNEDAKRLAATIARLEPGVRSVRNELVVATN